MTGGHLGIKCAAEPIDVVGAKMSDGFINNATNVMGTLGVP